MLYLIIEIHEELDPKLYIFTNKKDFNRYKIKCESYYYLEGRDHHFSFDCYSVKWSKNKKEFLHNLSVSFITNINPIWENPM